MTLLSVTAILAEIKYFRADMESQAMVVSEEEKMHASLRQERVEAGYYGENTEYLSTFT